MGPTCFICFFQDYQARKRCDSSLPVIFREHWGNIWSPLSVFQNVLVAYNHSIWIILLLTIYGGSRSSNPHDVINSKCNAENAESRVYIINMSHWFGRRPITFMLRLNKNTLRQVNLTCLLRNVSDLLSYLDIGLSINHVNTLLIPSPFVDHFTKTGLCSNLKCQVGLDGHEMFRFITKF